MTRKWLAGTAMVALLSVGAAAQTRPGPGPRGRDRPSARSTCLAPSWPTARRWRPAAYQVRLTAEAAQPSVPGIQMERWVEFRRGGKVVGREVVSIVPQAEVKDLQPGPEQPEAWRGQHPRRDAQGRRVPARVDQPRRRELPAAPAAGQGIDGESDEFDSSKCAVAQLKCTVSVSAPTVPLRTERIEPGYPIGSPNLELPFIPRSTSRRTARDAGGRPA